MSQSFPGFSKSLVGFLKELEKNNKKTWFDKNKKRYQEEVQQPFLDFIGALAPKIHAFAPHVVVDDRKSGGSMMRIYRDVRFSKDKKPYNTHAAARFRHDAGKNVDAPGFYVSISPKEIMLGTGIWRPESAALNKIRKLIAEDPARWKRIRDAKAFRAGFELGGESLKRPPKGFDPDSPVIEDLKRKDFVGFATWKPSAAAQKDFLAQCVKTWKASSRFCGFICEALKRPW